MKKLFWMAGLMMLAACSSHEVPTDGMSEAGTFRTVVAKATLPGGESRLALEEVDGKTIKVDWKESGETFSLMTETPVEDPVPFTQTTGDEFTGTIPADWTGPYYAFYPELEKDEDGNYLPSLGLDPVTTVSAEKVPFNLMFQTGKLEDLSPLMMAVSEDGENYAFKHLTNIVKLTLTGMEDMVGQPVMVVALQGLNTLGYYNLKEKKITPLNGDMDGQLGVQIDFSDGDLVVSNDGSVSVYLCLPPVSMDTPLIAVAVVLSKENQPIEYVNEGVTLTKDLEAGKYYRVTREVTPIETEPEPEPEPEPETVIMTAQTAEELMTFAEKSNSGTVAEMQLTLTADIDMNGKQWTPINQEYGKYRIFIDGGGYTIKNLTITTDEEYENNGFIAYLNGGTVENLHFENLTVTGGNAAGIVGYMYEGAVVRGCSVSGSVTGTTAAGIVGMNYGTIDACLNAATVTASSGSGGIAGDNHNIVWNSINVGDISVGEGGNYCGAIIGYNFDDALQVSNCYWSGDTAAGFGNDAQSTATQKVVDWTTFDFNDLNNSIAEIGYQFVFDETTNLPKVQKKTTGE